MEILDKDLNKLWLEHPKHGKSVDVIAIEVELPSDFAITTIEETIEPHNENSALNVGDDIFVLEFIPFTPTPHAIHPSF